MTQVSVLLQGKAISGAKLVPAAAEVVTASGKADHQLADLSIFRVAGGTQCRRCLRPVTAVDEVGAPLFTEPDSISNSPSCPNFL